MNKGRINTFAYFSMILSTVLLAAIAHAGPPYQTDDPEPVDVGERELYIAFEQTRTQDGTAGTLPLLELNYGPVPDLQVGIGIPYGFDDPRHGVTHRGIGDIELSAKYRLLQESQYSPMLSFFPLLALPSGDADKSLGNGKSQLFLPLWLQKNWGDWQSNSGGGYWINHAAGARNHWFFGWQLQKRIDAQWTVGGEIFHSGEETRGEGSSSGFNAGITYALDEHNHLLFSAGRGLSNADATNRFTSYVGYQLNW
jgi:hypothetical protein